MSNTTLPPGASLEYLKKLAKERVRELRRSAPDARLADARLAIAREHGFTSWRALKAEVDRRRRPELQAFFSACASGDVAALAALLDRDPELVHQKNRDGATALHVAVPHTEALRLLLARGADPNARDAGDHALALHFAAARGPLESVRALLDGGSDVHGAGDVHRLEVIGWATVFDRARRDVVELLIERGAKHHVFSAIALNDLDLVQRVIEDDPDAINRRLSRCEQEQTALHHVIAPADGMVGSLFRTGEHYRTLDMLIELGADSEAVDARGRTPLAIAVLRGDREAISRLHAAGAKEPTHEESERADPTELAASIRQLSPMLGVPDVDATVAWYRSIGFELTGSHSEGGRMDWASMKYGNAQVMFAPSTDPWRPKSALSLWLRTDRLDDLYASLKEKQLARARALLAGGAVDHPRSSSSRTCMPRFMGNASSACAIRTAWTSIFFQPLE